MIPEAAIYRGGPSAARIRELQEKYRCTPDGWFFERQADGSWKRGETRGFVFGVEAWKKAERTEG